MINNLQTINYQYSKPANFDEANPEFNIFKNVGDETLYEDEIEILPKVRIATNSVVFRYFKIFRESCIADQNYAKYSKGFSFFIKFIFPKFNFSKKRFLLITDEWTSNYYHWQIIALRKLLILKEKGFLENSLLLLPKKYKKYPFVLASLKKFGVNESQIIFLRRKSNIKVNQLAFAILRDWNHVSTLNSLREILSQNTQKNDVDFGDKIYISRQGQVLRFIENEAEVTQLLEKYGFKKIIAEKFSYDEQINIFHKAKYLVSPHGAGITNILTMPENSALLELATKPYEEKPVTDYYRLASMLNINYFYQECEAGESSKIKDFHHASLFVDLEKLEKNLQLMLKI